MASRGQPQDLATCPHSSLQPPAGLWTSAPEHSDSWKQEAWRDSLDVESPSQTTPKAVVPWSPSLAYRSGLRLPPG